MLNCFWILCFTTATFADLRAPKDSGIIVNPFYDPKDDANDIKKSDLNQMLPPTHQQLAETMNLRNIINNAVRTNSYAVGGNDLPITPHKPPKPFSWFMNLLASKSSKDLGSDNADGDDELGAVKAIDETPSGAAASLPPNQIGEINSNVIDSAILSRLESKPFTIPQQKVQREQLELVSIEEDLSFLHGHSVRSWVTIGTKSNAKNGLVGVGNSSLLLVADRNGAYEIVAELDLKTQIRCVTNYPHWNETSKTVHSIVIVELASQLLFISTGDNADGLAIVWQWTIHSSLDSLTCFKHESSDMLLMVNSQSTGDSGLSGDSGVSGDIYRFDLQSRDTWLVQKISLNHSCKSVTVINTYRQLIMAFAQNNTVELYKSDHHAATALAFKYFESIEATSVQTVVGFQMGGFSYLATTGLEPKIFRYHRGSFMPQTILSRRWGLVEFVYPIPARTYRDDLILLVQHRIMMGTHTVTVVDVLIWNGESFDVSLSVPCRIGDDIQDFGMTCLLDYERDAGIDGLSIIQNGNSISLVVPRVDAPSSMFRLKFQLKSFDSPTETVVKNFEISSKHIEAATNYQNEIVSTGSGALVRGLNADRNDVTAMWNLSTVTAGSLTVSDGAEWKVDEKLFGNENWTEDNLSANVADMWTILLQLKDDVDQLEKELTGNNFVGSEPDSPIYRIPAPYGDFDMQTARVLSGGRRLKRAKGADIDGRMNLDQLNVKHIRVDYINDVPVEDLVFTSDGTLNSVDSLIIENSLNVLSEVGVTGTETVGESKPDGRFLDKLIPGENIHVTGDLAVDSINGVLWQDFVHQIVLKNLPNLIHKLVVTGQTISIQLIPENKNLSAVDLLCDVLIAKYGSENVVAKENIAVDYLNRISFPGDFLWMHDSDISIVSGQKVFTGALTVEAVDTSGTVDGISTHETISLDESQHIGGLTTFAQLEVTDILDVNGTINGKHLNEFKPNLSLLQSNIIASDCLFQHLQVYGPILVSNNCNGLILDEIFADVVYKSHPKSTISSFKTFDTVESVVELTSNLINNIPVGDFMTADTAQDITFDQLVGNVFIHELYTGLLDFINVTELDQNSIKLTGEQFTEAELIFEDGSAIDVDTIEIQRTFNGLSWTDLIRVDDSVEINGNVVVNSAIINDLVIGGEVNGNGMVNGVTLSEFDAIRFSKTRAQHISSIYHIENVVIDNDIDATYVNGIDILELRRHMNHITNLADFLSSTDVKVNNLVIDGQLVVQSINGHDFNSIKDNAVWLNQPNIVIGELQFLDKIEIDRGTIVNNVNGESFDDFVNGVVLQSSDNVEFVGRKIFQNEFHVDQDIRIDTLNGIPSGNIWTKSSPTPTATISAVNVVGDLLVESVNLQGYANSVYWHEIEDNYRFDAERGAHVFTNNVRFTSPTNINHLRIQHGLQSVDNITDYLSSIVRKNHGGLIGGRKKFQCNAIFMNHLHAAHMDALDMPSLFDSIILNDANQKIVIIGDIAFEDDVTASHFHVSGGILTSTLMDCRLAEWNENALSTNAAVNIFQPIAFPPGTLLTTNVQVQFLNNNAMVTIFALNADQDFGHSLMSDMISTSNINVGGHVNGYNVKTLLDNSVLVTGDNVITAPTTLQYARVLSILQTVGTVNGKNLNNIATLHEDLYLYGPLSFRSIKARNLVTKDTISGIDFDYWYANALWKSQREQQIIRGRWTVTEVIFLSSVTGDATLNGVPITNLTGQINGHNANVLNNFEMFSRGYVEQCHKMQHLIEKTQTLPYFVSHFEESFSLRLQSVLNSVHFFEAYGQNYVVINLGCATVLYVWNRRSENYEKILETETGNVDSWLDMLDETESLHLISNTETDRSNCPTSGLNIWKFDGKAFIHVARVTDKKQFSLLHRSKLNPQRFLAMTKDDGIVSAFDLDNNLVEQWHLPTGNDRFRFVPENANLGIALSNGKQLSSLSYAKSAKSAQSTDKRKERSISPLDDPMELKRFIRCPYLEEKLQNATVNCKLWHQANLKALSNIGPYKQIDPSTQSRLLEDVNMSNIQQDRREFKLKKIPANRAMGQGIFQQLVPVQQSPVGASTGDTPLQNAGNQLDSKPVDSTARDIFGDIEKATIETTDKIIDSLIETDAEKENVDFDDSLIGAPSTNESRIEPNPRPSSTIDTQPLPTTGNQFGSAGIPVNTSARDVFGDIEKVTIETTDKIIDSLIETDAEKENVDFDDSLIGAPKEDENVKNPSSITITRTNDSQPSSPRGLFDNMKEKAIKLTDKVTDAFEKIKDTAKESQAKLHNMFEVQPPVNEHGQFGKKESVGDPISKFEDKNLPEIPKVSYVNSPTDVHSTESPFAYGSDGMATTASTEHFTTTESPTTHDEVVGENEPKISQEISSEGIATAENENFPNHPAEEIVAITVGRNGKHLIAVSSLREHTIQGKHDLIRIYEDIIEGNLFQTLLCQRPRSLAVLNVRDETILSFIENDAEVQIFVYRGIQGFVKFTSFELPSFVVKLTSIHLPVANPFECTKSFLAATMKKEIRFIEAKTCGYCGINAQLRCE